MSEVVVIGSGGHCRSVVAVLQSAGLNVIGVYDDSWKEGADELIVGVPLIGRVKDVPADAKVVLASGVNATREELFAQFSDRLHEDVIVHQSAIIEPSVLLGRANIVFAMAYINADAQIGDNNILNSGCIVEHECRIGDHSHISIGTNIGGRSKVGSRCFIGAGAVLKDMVSICDDVIVGAGGVVVKSITQPGTYVGNPVRKVK